MAFGMKAITPKRLIIAPPGTQLAESQRFLRDFAFEFTHAMQEYPPWMPWKRPPTSGPRKGGRRTGNYGRQWFQTFSSGGNRSWVTVLNHVEENGRQYGIYVGGPKRGVRGRRQAKAMAARGWVSSSTVASKLRRKYTGQLLIRRMTQAGASNVPIMGRDL